MITESHTSTFLFSLQFFTSRGNGFCCLGLSLSHKTNKKLYFVFIQASKVEDLGPVDFEEEIKKRFKMVYVPTWFNVDLKTGVIEMKIITINILIKL